MISMYYRTAHSSAGQADRFDIISVERKSLKATFCSVGNQQIWLCFPGIDCYTVCVIEVLGLLASSSKIPQQFSLFVVVHYILQTVSISNIEFAIFQNRSFCRNKFFGLFVGGHFFGVWDSQQYFTVEGGFVYFVAVVVCDK